MTCAKATLYVAAFLFGLGGCTMSSANPSITPGDGYTEIAAEAVGEQADALTASVQSYLRDGHQVRSVSYYTVVGDVPWVAVSKNAQNRFAEKGISVTRPEWHRVGYDLIDLFETKDGGAVAVAMMQQPLPDGRKLVGYYTLAQ